MISALSASSFQYARTPITSRPNNVHFGNDYSPKPPKGSFNIPPLLLLTLLVSGFFTYKNIREQQTASNLTNDAFTAIYNLPKGRNGEAIKKKAYDILHTFSPLKVWTDATAVNVKLNESGTSYINLTTDTDSSSFIQTTTLKYKIGGIEEEHIAKDTLK